MGGGAGAGGKVAGPGRSEVAEPLNLGVVRGAAGTGDANDVGVVPLGIDMATAARGGDSHDILAPYQLDADKAGAQGGKRLVGVVEEVGEGGARRDLQNRTAAAGRDGLQVGGEAVGGDTVEEDGALEVGVAFGCEASTTAEAKWPPAEWPPTM